MGARLMNILKFMKAEEFNRLEEECEKKSNETSQDERKTNRA